MEGILPYAVAAAFVAALATHLMVPPVARLAVALRALDHPGGRKHQAGSVPRLGGVAIALEGVAKGAVGVAMAAHGLPPSPGTGGSQSEYRVEQHGKMPSPRPGQQSHHGVMSAWMKKHFARYDPHKAPAILMPEEAHRATFGVYN